MKVLDDIKKGLIVSCQALSNEPLHSPLIMAKMAKAAEMGGAVAIRANGFEDIKAIRREVKLPIIGLIKKNYEGYKPYITPTIEEVSAVVKAGADIVAIDATKLIKPGDISTKDLLREIKKLYPNILVMADISTYNEGIEAENLGFDIVSTTLSGYTDYSPKIDGPDFELIERLAKELKVPLIAEGRIWTPEEAIKALELGAYAVVVGTAITRPQEITKRFTDSIRKAVKYAGTK
ncbi:N-acetylmannosamine-6-phosphate 2-epimerase [Thermoanaerobacterium thermosaccharolyticum]|uniref:N-acetylmannosamine-6-phosphate 2-epimerase n=1 Tax=Thermoanaerobacterium thermosaccharolyticum TaxID=1517 RepID=UPI0017805755|nr:N-acetylmannosamine-6-phosphate 2-epimerase [Thermoanaerobacterium thermosaccharolyticum]MBE0070069.1 N-acetylmannosamine-6-phosphate 2-epimerase [Thermoanaerobacterium thermosaccharolyticum]MBE0227920.1 N-acetylmannosamine-6-phosphate 2-epimerase [Thermoanaerobacterium thermosaccharolyticum]